LKKFKYALFLLLALSFTATLFSVEPAPKAPTESTFIGSSTLGAQSYDSLSGSGLLKLNGTTIKNLQISGSLIAHSATLQSLEVQGEANLNQSTVTQPSTIIGYLRAQHSTFKAPLTLGAQKAVFTASQLHSLTIRKDDSFKGKQIIELKQGTIIDGPVHFESGKGEIHLFPPSKVLGPVTGGKIIRKS
jgi:hypothetical protein